MQYVFNVMQMSVNKHYWMALTLVRQNGGNVGMALIDLFMKV